MAVADDYKKQRFSTGEEYLTQQEFGLISDEMKEQLGLVEDIKKQNPSMLNFMSAPTVEDVFMFEKPVEFPPTAHYSGSGRNLAGVTAGGYVPWESSAANPAWVDINRMLVEGGEMRTSPSPHPRIAKEPMIRQAFTGGREKSWEVPATDPAWQRSVAIEGKIGVKPGAKAHILMHEQIHNDIKDLVYSRNLSEENYLKLDQETEEALINYLVVQSGIPIEKVQRVDILAQLKNYQERWVLSPDKFEERMEGWIDILNDAKRSQVENRRQLKTVPEPLSSETEFMLDIPRMQVLPTEPGSNGLSPKLQGMRDDLIRRGLSFWSNEDIADLYGTSVEDVEKRRQEILGETTAPEATPETVAQPSVADRLSGLLPKGRTESGIGTYNPGYLPGKQTVGEARAAQSPVGPVDFQHWDVGAEEGLEGNLVEVGTYNLDKDTVQAMGLNPWYKNRAMLDPEAAASFKAMEKDFGGDIKIESAFRSEIHNNALKKLGLEASETSNHLRGLAIDVLEPSALKWLKANGKKYGWKIAGENHFNFVGI